MWNKQSHQVERKLYGFRVIINHPQQYEAIGQLAKALKSKNYVAAGTLIDHVASTAKKLSEEYASIKRNDPKLELIIKKEEALLEDLRKIFMETLSAQLKNTEHWYFW